ncbi:MAG: hypothetical protein ACK4SO_04545 [Candidatus Kapaibacteriota bacterium]
MNKVSNLIIFLCLFLPSLTIFSQGLEEQPSPLGPAKPRQQTELGIFVGLGPNWQTGELFASCDCPSFRDGSGLAFGLGLLFQRDITSFLQWGAVVGLSLLNSTSSYKERELLVFESETGEKFNNIPVLFRQKSQVGFSNFDLMPFLNFSLWDVSFLRLGIKASLPFYTHINHTKELLDKSVRLENGETISISIGNGDVVKLEDGFVEQVNSFLFSFTPAIGFSFNLTGNIFLGFAFTYQLPLNNYSERGKNYRWHSWFLSLELKYALVLRKWLE